METLPADICYKIFCLLDHQNLAVAQQGRRCLTSFNSGYYVPVWEFSQSSVYQWNWMSFARQDELWRNLFIKRWGTDQANFFSPVLPKTWKMAYETQDRSDRVGLGLTITCEGSEYYIVHQGEIQRWLGSKKSRNTNYGTPYMETIDRTLSIPNGSNIIESNNTETLTVEKGPCIGLFDKILFFIGDLEKASRQVKRSRIL